MTHPPPGKPSGAAFPPIEFIGFNQHLGMRMVDWAPDRAVIELAIRPEMLNRSGIVHGGVLATLADAAGGFAGAYTGVGDCIRPVLTLSLTTSFIDRAAPGILRATARKRGGGRRIYAATIDITDSDGRTVAIGEATYCYAD